jgi:hypothetical protein
MDPLHETVKRGIKLNILIDEDPLNPLKEYDQLGTYACFGRHSHLGNFTEYTDPEEIAEYIKSNQSLVWELYYNEQSGELTMSKLKLEPEWDMGGHVGWVFIPRDKVLRDYGAKILHQKLKMRMTEYIKAEVKEYSAYLSGEVYGYLVGVVDDEGDIDYDDADSCWGISSYEECSEEAYGILEHRIDKMDKSPEMFKEMYDGMDGESSEDNQPP